MAAASAAANARDPAACIHVQVEAGAIELHRDRLAGLEGPYRARSGARAGGSFELRRQGLPHGKARAIGIALVNRRSCRGGAGGGRGRRGGRSRCGASHQQQSAGNHSQ